MNMTTMKDELKSVKYYYTKKEHFDKMENIIDVSSIKLLVDKYNKAIVGADPQLLDLYHALYVEGHSQVELALEWNFSFDYIKQLTRKLNKYLLDKINKEGA
ncbi:MAG: hypothetical protein E7338_02110 [Clostridiales bacterium]|nr:hypothetical protein [Clostridiales bacterium]